LYRGDVAQLEKPVIAIRFAAHLRSSCR